MKKQIISLLLILSFSVQSTYPLLDSVRKKIAGSAGVKKAKELLNIKANIRCLTKGDNCTKEKRAMLGTISTLMATLVAAGVIAASVVITSQVGGGKELTEEEKKDKKFLIFDEAIGMKLFTQFETVKLNARKAGIPLKDVIYEGSSLIGAVVASPAASSKTLSNTYESGFKNVIKELLQAGVQPTENDKLVIRGNYSRMDFGWLYKELNMR